MTNILTLDDIRAQAEAKFGATEIPLPDKKVCRLVSPMRLTKTQRAALTELTSGADKDEDSDSEADAEAQIVGIFRIAAETEAQAEGLLDALRNSEGDLDLALATIVVQSYMKAQQVGEA